MKMPSSSDNNLLVTSMYIPADQFDLLLEMENKTRPGSLKVLLTASDGLGNSSCVIHGHLYMRVIAGCEMKIHWVFGFKCSKQLRYNIDNFLAIASFYLHKYNVSGNYVKLAKIQ